MIKLFKSKLKMRLSFWIVFDVTVAMLVVSIINIKTSHDNSLLLAGRTYANAAKQVAVFVDSKISAVQSALKVLSGTSEIAYPETDLHIRAETANAAAKAIGNNTGIYLTDSNGLVLLGETGVNLSSEGYIKDALNGKAHVTVPFYDAATGKMAMIVAQPVIWEEEVVGAVFIKMSEEFINETIASVDTGHNGDACIFDSAGNIIAHSDMGDIIQSGKKSYIELAKTDSSYKSMAEAVSVMINGKSGTITYTDNTGQVTLGGYCSTQNGWSVLVRDLAAEVNADANSAITGSIIGAVLCLTLIIAIAPRLMGKITAPINFISRILDQVGICGDLSLQHDDEQELLKYTAKIDEIGICAKALSGHFKHFQEVEGILERLSEGDLTVEVQQLSERDNISIALAKMSDSLNEMFSEIHRAATVVSSGSGQVSDGSNMLAQGASEQSAATEELSAAITDITQRTNESMALTEKAANLSKTIRANAEKGSSQMEQMIFAVNEINEAGQNISKVMKVIDDIAFQTNILALNAAVEAARAGQHGKGFAVVAEEVRSLASKSAEAAKNTGNLITNTTEKAELGVKIASETSESFEDIVRGINETDSLIGSIAVSTGIQSQSISEISKSSDHISQIAQRTSAAAQESAAAAQEMNGQAIMLENSLGQFKLKSIELPFFKNRD